MANESKPGLLLFETVEKFLKSKLEIETDSNLATVLGFLSMNINKFLEEALVEDGVKIFKAAEESLKEKLPKSEEDPPRRVKDARQSKDKSKKKKRAGRSSSSGSGSSSSS